MKFLYLKRDGHAAAKPHYFYRLPLREAAMPAQSVSRLYLIPSNHSFCFLVNRNPRQSALIRGYFAFVLFGFRKIFLDGKAADLI